MDRMLGLSLGRPCAIQDEDFDVELPVECDDEYWELSDHSDPEKAHVKMVAFKQPPGKPSKITYFNCFLRLNQILAFALRTVYSINKSKTLLGLVGKQWEQHIVAELDSALNKWIDSVPDHLRWDPHRENLLFLNQSAHLYAHYYQLQIAVHRPFIPSPRKPSPLSFPSLAICTNAARSCIHVLAVPFKTTNTVISANRGALLTSGIVLLLSIWGGKRSGLSIDPAKEMEDVHLCMKMLKELEPKWHTAGRLWDILHGLVSLSDLPLPSPSPSNKRDREGREDTGDTNSTDIPPTPVSSHADSPSDRQMAGSRRVFQQQARHQQQHPSPTSHQAMSALSPTSHQPSLYASPSQSPHVSSSFETSGPPSNAPTMAANTNYSFVNDLPMYTADLGRMPLHPGLISDSMNTQWSSPAVHALATTATAQAPSYMSNDPAPHSIPNMPSMFAGPSTAPAPESFEQMMSTLSGTPFVSNLDGYASVFNTGMDAAGPDAARDMGTNAMGSGASFGMERMDPAGSVFADSDTLAMWSNAPPGFEWDDWGAFLSQGLDPQGNGETEPSR
ncbi:hypothetical protein EIP91_008734 [Steccherinum ochraceum]|uniref:Xylanolytic transcriptional activator regulatory domain-containing protein n=1 Tax=Steccherinum ochraceum TaxID=92696 RepID=A0A4R0RPJ3_9APHY|nr:hypothetical protein EIP91_008734 [Steccherinum ochraceum]